MQDQVDGLVGRRQADGAQYRLRIVDADAAGDGTPRMLALSWR